MKHLNGQVKDRLAAISGFSSGLFYHKGKRITFI
jgi:hypothetical protein